MSKYNFEEIVVWESDQGRTLCPECFEKEFTDYPVDWTPVMPNDEKETLHECDNEDCKKRFAN